MTIGCALVVVGLAADHKHWWDGHEFLTNLVSSVTSLCFGVPAALLVFSHLGDTQTLAREAARAKLRATREIDEFRAVLLQPFAASDLDELGVRIDEASRALTGMRRARRKTEEEKAAAAVAVQNALNAVLPIPERVRTSRLYLERFRGREHWSQSMRHWEPLLEAQWKVLDDEVRPRMTEASLDWIASPVGAAARQAIKQLHDDGRNPWRVRWPSSSGEHDSDLYHEFERNLTHFLMDVTSLVHAASAMELLYPTPRTIATPPSPPDRAQRSGALAEG
ncbi:hypothetical protein [Streptomyces canus]|uniref:hypothetical protein n=1 Tax=Streptomyces canus TaxID=58343 RepID=UPI0036E6A83C